MESQKKQSSGTADFYFILFLLFIYLLFFLKEEQAEEVKNTNACASCGRPWTGSNGRETFEIHVDPGLFRCPFCHYGVIFKRLCQYTIVAVKALMAVPLCSCVFIVVTGSCFFIFSSALKASAGYLAKSSIVEGRMPAQRCRVPHLNLLSHFHLFTCREFTEAVQLNIMWTHDLKCQL